MYHLQNSSLQFLLHALILRLVIGTILVCKSWHWSKNHFLCLCVFLFGFSMYELVLSCRPVIYFHIILTLTGCLALLPHVVISGRQPAPLGRARLGYSGIRIFHNRFRSIFRLFCSCEQNSKNGNPRIPEWE